MDNELATADEPEEGEEHNPEDGPEGSKSDALDTMNTPDASRQSTEDLTNEAETQPDSEALPVEATRQLSGDPSSDQSDTHAVRISQSRVSKQDAVVTMAGKPPARMPQPKGPAKKAPPKVARTASPPTQNSPAVPAAGDSKAEQMVQGLLQEKALMDERMKVEAKAREVCACATQSLEPCLAAPCCPCQVRNWPAKLGRAGATKLLAR